MKNIEFKKYEVTSESKDGHKFIFETNASNESIPLILNDIMISKGWTEFDYKVTNIREMIESVVDDRIN